MIYTCCEENRRALVDAHATLNGIANATATQDATIEQGDDMSEGGSTTGSAGASATTTP